MRKRQSKRGSEARVRECRRDISKSSGAFGARSQDLPYWFLDAEQERRSRRDRARVVVTAVVIIVS